LDFIIQTRPTRLKIWSGSRSRLTQMDLWFVPTRSDLLSQLDSSTQIYLSQFFSISQLISTLISNNSTSFFSPSSFDLTFCLSRLSLTFNSNKYISTFDSNQLVSKFNLNRFIFYIKTWMWFELYKIGIISAYN